MRPMVLPGILVVAALSLPAAAVTRYVNVNNTTPESPYTNWAQAATDIQTAVYGSASGDEILVAAGTYALTAPVYISIPLAVRSVAGPRSTKIDAQYMTRCLEALLYSPGVVTIDGFTLANGSADFGSGAYLDGGVSAQIILQNCHVVSNWAGGYAGGVFATRGVLVSNCVVQGNVAATNGAGFVLMDGPLVRNCRIEGNSAYGSGGGVYVQDTATVSHCTIRFNYAARNGGGVCMAAQWFIQGATLLNDLLYGNYAGDGGGVWTQGSNYVGQCTNVDNIATNRGGGLATWDAAYQDVIIDNSILYYNVDVVGYPNYYADVWAFQYCCLLPDPATFNYNIAEAPLFVDRGGYDYHLAVGSPCIDSVRGGFMAVLDDLDGRWRPADGDLDTYADKDIGAYEYEFVVKSFVIEGDVASVTYEGFSNRAYRVFGATSLTDPVWFTLDLYDWGLNPPGTRTIGIDSSEPFRVFRVAGLKY